MHDAGVFRTTSAIAMFGMIASVSDISSMIYGSEPHQWNYGGFS